jgi:SRSO17 transposase
MDAKQLKQLKPELELFLDRYAPCFPLDAHAEHARKFVQGLLLGGERRNAENIAEGVEGGVVRSMQKFIGQGRWSDDPVQEELRRHVVEVLGDPDAILNVDETGMPKKGTKSVGVKRQYAGCLGRVDNCQIGVFVNYCSARDHTLIDRRLYLPEDWAQDRARREEAGVPPEVVFRTKPELALEMVRQAFNRDMPFQWVTGDSIYGDSPTFVQGVRDLGKWYVVDSSSEAHVWTKEPQLLPSTNKRGGAGAKPKVASKPERVADVVARIPATAWRTITVAEGSQGPRMYEYTEMSVWFSEAGVPSGRERLLVRRSLDQKAECKYHRSNAPSSVRLDKLAQVRGAHWSVEQSFEAGKGECGLDEYETRGWVGWHHHTMLSMLALWFLSLQKRRLGEKRATAHGSRGSGTSRPLAGQAALGRKRDPALVSVAAGA